MMMRVNICPSSFELLETQGDSTLLLLTDSQIDEQLSPTERHDFAD